jgi:hypothetical protein
VALDFRLCPLGPVGSRNHMKMAEWTVWQPAKRAQDVSRGRPAWATLSWPSGPQPSMSESLSSIFELGGSHQQAGDVVMLASRTYESVYRGHQPAQLIGSATALIVS